MSSNSIQIEKQETDSCGTVLVSVPQAAKRLTISRRQYYRLAARGELPQPVRICGVSRVALCEIDAVIAAAFGKRIEV